MSEIAMSPSRFRGLTGALEEVSNRGMYSTFLNAPFVDARIYGIPGGSRKPVIRPFTAVTRVQIPPDSRIFCQTWFHLWFH